MEGCLRTRATCEEDGHGLKGIMVGLGKDEVRSLEK